MPHGISGLSKRIHDLGLKFGLWFEPERVNEDSNLYRNHPEWVLKTPHRKSCHGRNQYILDFSNPEVVEYIAQAMMNVIDDSYNANPASMRSAINLLASLENKTVLVLGDMAELGSDVEREHAGIGQYAAQMGVSALYALGRYADDYKRGFQSDGNRLAYVANDYDQLAELLMEHDQGSTLLVKGSRSAAMENVIHCLTKLENTREGSH